MKKTIYLAIFFLTCIKVNAQHETDKWYFGFNVGVDFSGSSPVVLNDGALSNIEGCASISDSIGNLLFYTDGMTVWNRLHQPMPNGTGLLGGFAVQAALIVPQPSNPGIYYLFTNDAVNGPNGFQYSIVDMSLDSGRGDVASMNHTLQDGLTERMSAIAQSQANGYWITVHEYGTDTFYTYSLTDTGLDSIVGISAAGIRHTTETPQNAYGQMKFSPCGNKLAVAVGYKDTVDVFDFDDATGIISNPISIPMPAHVFGVEFSPDGQKLYVSSYGNVTLYQFDLSSGVPSTIIGSSTALSISLNTYGLQLASDGKIYVVKNQDPWLGVITYPDSAGPSCHYVDTALYLDPLMLGHSTGLCLPGFVQSFFRTPTSCLINGIEDVHGSQMQLFPNPSSTFFNIKLNTSSDLFIYNMSGMLVENIHADAGELKLGNNLKPGIYFIQIDAKGERSYVRVVKIG